MAVDVVRGDVEEDADRRIDARRQIHLERRDLDDVVAAEAGRIERQDRRADIAAELDVASGALEEMRDQRRRRRLAVGAGDGDEGSGRHVPPPLAAEELDVADDLDAGAARPLHRPVRNGMGERHARRQHQRGEQPPVGEAEVLDRDAGRARRLDHLVLIVPSGDDRTAGGERRRRRAAAAAEAEDRDLLSAEARDRDHRRVT